MYFFILTCHFFSILFFQLPFFLSLCYTECMKKTVYHSKSIRNRILIFTLSAILGMCLLISLFSYYIFRHYLQNTLIPVHRGPACDCCRNPWTTVLMKCTGWSDIARQIPILPIILNITPIPALSCPYPLMIPSTRNAAGILLIIICPELPLSHRSIICRW